MSTEALVILRCFNDVAVVGETLDRVFAQRGASFRVVAIDSGSSDGSVAVLRRFPLELIEIPLGTYVPGRVLNLGMRQGVEPWGVFVNSDCTPQHDEWLAELLAPLHADARVAAVYGRQIPRPDAVPLVVKDYERAFGDGSIAARWRHFFSMASSAIRRSVWEQRPFDESMRYSEDVAWSWDRRREGWRIAYAARSIAMHSHNYTRAELAKRFRGEGEADAAIYPRDSHATGMIACVLRPFLTEVARDVLWCLRRGEWRGLGDVPGHRWTQRRAYREGLLRGLAQPH